MKISAALLRFARPLTELLPPVPPTAELQRMLELAKMVWNAVVVEELGHASPYLRQAHAAVKSQMAEPARGVVLGLLAELERQKRREVPPDLRLIGEIEIRQGKDGGHSLFATQIAPPAPAKTTAAEPAAADPWAELYSAAREFQSLAPWHWMVDSQVFGVRDPATGEIGWCCVIGAAGELSGLIVYRGDTGFDAYRRLQSGESLPDEGPFGQDALLFAFVDRANMPKVELQRLKRLGLSFRGARRWPLFESHATGRLPIPLTDAEAERMLHALRATKEVALALRDVPRWLEPDPGGCLRVQTRDADGWRPQRVAPPAPVLTPIPSFDLVRAERTKRKLKPGHAVLECDLCPLPIVIDERKGHPYSPASFLLVDAASGAILHQQMGPPEERHAMAQLELMSALERLGLAPAALRVKRPDLARVLAPLGAALGIEIQLVEELPVMDEVQALTAEFFQRMPAGRSRL